MKNRFSFSSLASSEKSQQFNFGKLLIFLRAGQIYFLLKDHEKIKNTTFQYHLNVGFLD